MNKYVNNLTLPNGTNVLIKDLEGRTNLSNEIRRATEKETELEDAHNNLRNDLTTETNARKQGDNKNNAEIAKIHSNITEIENKNTEQDNEITTIHGDITAIENKNTEQDNEITTIHGDITAIENKNTEQDNELSTLRTMISSPYNFKGDVANKSALPASGEVNDTYYVQDVKYKVTWTGSAWVQSSLSEADYQTELSELKSDLNNLQDMKKILDYTSFENGYFNIDGYFRHNSELASAWMGHRKYLSVGNAKQIVFKHSYSSKVQFNIYKFAKDKTGKSLEQIFVEPNVNHYYNIDRSDYFYAISINKDNVSDFTPSNVNPIVSLIEYDCTASKEDSVIPNLPEITVSNYATVGTKGTEDYSDLGVAYNGMGGNGYLIVEPMSYDCGNHGFDVQKLYIKGCAKELVKFENNSLLYPYASALIKNECVVENIHFKAGNTSTSKNGAYAVHIEHNNTQGKTMVFRNCIFESEFQSGVGVGLRKDTNLIFENCEFINKFSIADSVNVKKPDDYTTSGALFFHGSIDSTNLGTQHITCRNCTFKSYGASALRIEDVPGNLVVATFVNCNFYSKYYGTMNPIDIVGGAEKGYLCGNSVKLGKVSHGNNIPQLNAY